MEKYWYAILRDETDSDCGMGSYDLKEAKKMAHNNECKIIAVISEDENDWICVDEIRLDGIRVWYGAGESRAHAGLGVDYLLADIDEEVFGVDEIYVEMELPDPDEDDWETKCFKPLKKAFLEKATELGIAEDMFVFNYEEEV